MESKVNKTKMMITSKIWKVTLEGKFPCAVFRKVLGSNSILCQFCRCWVHKRCSFIKAKQNDNSKFKYQTCTNQETYMAKDCAGMELNGQFFEIAEKFCYIGDTKGA